MDQIIKRISEQLANQPSRRGFFSTVGKATLGAAAILAGQGFFTENALAAPSQCCTGPSCANTVCANPSSCTVGYYWCCSHGHQEKCTCTPPNPNNPNCSTPCSSPNCANYSPAYTCADYYSGSTYVCTIQTKVR